MSERPAYKQHPLWESAMALTRDAYALAERVQAASPDAASRLRKSAVAVPAHVAGALSEGPARRREHVLAARGAIAEVARQAERSRDESSRELARQAETLDLMLLFEFGPGDRPDERGERAAACSLRRPAPDVVLVGAALWFPRWWENRLFRQAEAMTGVGSRVMPGT